MKKNMSKILDIKDRIKSMIPYCSPEINNPRIDLCTLKGEDGNLYGYKVSTESDEVARCLINEFRSAGFKASYIQ